jgi:MraZ protein
MAEGSRASFSGIYTCPLDEKNRAVLPARLRDAVSLDQLRDGFVVTEGFEGCLLLFLKERWQELERKFGRLPFTNPDARLFKRYFLAPALPVAIDRVGRLMLSDFHRQLAGIDREALITGMGDHLELWDPRRWEEYRSKNADRYAQVAALLLEEEGDSVPRAPEGSGLGAAERSEAVDGGGRK